MSRLTSLLSNQMNGLSDATPEEQAAAALAAEEAKKAEFKKQMLKWGALGLGIWFLMKRR